MGNFYYFLAIIFIIGQNNGELSAKYKANFLKNFGKNSNMSSTSNFSIFMFSFLKPANQ